jgi:hypothetical protein
MIIRKPSYVLILCALCMAPLVAMGQQPLRNDLYIIRPQADGSFSMANVEGGGAEVFRPEFTAIASTVKPTDSRAKLDNPVYNIPAWKVVDEVVTDLFEVGETLVLKDPEISNNGNGLTWKFDHDRVQLLATVSLPRGKSEPRIDYTATVKKEGYFTFAYTGAPALRLAEVAKLWQPLVWDGRRLPEKSFLIPDGHCSIPGCLVQRAGEPRTIGVIADPWQFPYEMPHTRNRRFGVCIRNTEGKAQTMVFAPFLGSKTRFKAGDEHKFSVQLVSRPHDLNRTFEYVARDICGFRDRRENTLTTLNQTLDNMAEYALGEWARFDVPNKSSYYPDAKGTVKNVSSLHPIGIALATDNPRFFHEQTVPIMEYLLSREKFLFAISKEGLGHSQKPSMNLNGPAMPVSELAALHRITRGNSPVFLDQAQRLHPKDRRLNMNWITPGATWQRSLSLYRATGESKWLDDASKKADRYIAQRLAVAPTDFAEAADGTFFEYMVPQWKELYELYLETRDPNHLAAAHQGARRYAQFVWFYPSVPDRDIIVNPRGLAPRRGNPNADGEIPVAKETVPAWRVSDQGLVCEGSGTVQRLGILLATHAPIFLRIANDTEDDFLREIARSAVIGRYANFPGYHLNTRFSTAQEKPDFPLHAYKNLKPTTSMHFNHILPMVNLVIDYLFSRSYDLSDGAIDFPAEFAEGYAYLQGRIYGSRTGRFYDEKDVWPWMPRNLLEVADVQVNYVAARGEDKLCIAFMNASDRALEDVTFELQKDLFQDYKSSPMRVEVRRDNKAKTETVEIRDGEGRVSLSPRGITAIIIHGVKPKVQFQSKLGPAKPIVLENTGPQTVAGCTVEANVLSFGPNLRWLHVFLRSKTGMPEIEGAYITLDMSGEKKRLADTTFPHEFSVPINSGVTKIRYSVGLNEDSAPE